MVQEPCVPHPTSQWVSGAGSSAGVALPQYESAVCTSARTLPRVPPALCPQHALALVQRNTAPQRAVLLQVRRMASYIIGWPWQVPGDGCLPIRCTTVRVLCEPSHPLWRPICFQCGAGVGGGCGASDSRRAPGAAPDAPRRRARHACDPSPRATTAGPAPRARGAAGSSAGICARPCEGREASRVSAHTRVPLNPHPPCGLGRAPPGAAAAAAPEVYRGRLRRAPYVQK